MPVIPATPETEAGESLEPMGWRLQWAKTVPLHSSLGNKSEIPSQKKVIIWYIHVKIIQPLKFQEDNLGNYLNSMEIEKDLLNMKAIDSS